MRIGVTLPSFRDGAGEALAAARRAEELGLDGVFVFDHVWPMGQPHRPALSALPLLGAVAATTSRISLGPLVARVGMLPDGVLTGALLSLSVMAPGRFIAGLGTGDAKSAAENGAYGVPFGTAAERRESLGRCVLGLRDRGVAVWVGGGAPATLAVAEGAGVAVNLWEATPEALAVQAGRGEVTWGGPLPGGAVEMAERLGALRSAGATWAVCAWPGSLEEVAGAAALLRAET